MLVLSRSYPNNVMDVLGLWVRSQVREVSRFCDVKVVSPVPYCPPVPGLPENYTRFRRVARRLQDGSIESIHPRMFIGPGYSTHTTEWLLYLLAVRPTLKAIRRDFPFDVIHAQFTYPDGVAAVHLGRRFGVPVVITEQNIWGPWLNQYPSVRARSIQAAKASACQIAISQAVRRTIEQFAGRLDTLVVIPDGVDGSEFTPRPAGLTARTDQILFVGAVRPVKGVDVLLRALRVMADHGRSVRLNVVGAAFFNTYQREEGRLKQMVDDLEIADRVHFLGKQPLPQLVRHMQESGAIVLPSRAESLGMVLIEALACGTPVVATRCGGPEDIVNDRVGVLVSPEDPEALARGIEHVLDHRASYEPRQLRAHALEHFGIEYVGQRLLDVYEDAVRRHRARARPPSAAVAASVTP